MKYMERNKNPQKKESIGYQKCFFSTYTTGVLQDEKNQHKQW